MRLCFIIVLAVVGCARSGLAPKFAEARTPEEARVVAIARKAVAQKETWAIGSSYCVPQRCSNGWTVIVCQIEGYDQNGKPRLVPGGYRMLSIDESGAVTDYVREH